MFKKKQPVHTEAPSRVPSKPLLASASMLTQQQIRRSIPKQDQLDEAWDLYSRVPEIRYATSWRAAACSRARLYVARKDNSDTSGNPRPVDDERLQAPLRELANGADGHGQLLARMSLHLDVVGETWLIGYDTPAGARRWMVASRDEFDLRSGRPRVRQPETDDWIDLDPNASAMIRIWRPHPRRSNWPDSPVLALRPVARELLSLSDRVTAENDSRLAGAGILKVPNEISLPKPDASTGTPNPVNDTDFTEALMEAMVTPLKDRDSASAVVPIIARGPAEYLPALEHLSFASSLDDQILPLRESALRRLATVLDVEPEVVQGAQADNHWTAWFSEEAGIKLHIRPLLELMCDALSGKWYHPYLEAMSVPGFDEYYLWPDTTDLVVRPNRGPDAVTLFDRRLLSAEATRAENGFNDTDAPDPVEQRQWIALDLVQAIPALAPTLLPLVGIDPGDTPTEDAPNNPQAPTQPTPPPGPDDGGQGGPPTVMASVDTTQWIVSTLEVAALRALDKAGKWVMGRSRSRRAEVADVASTRIHTRIPISQEDLDTALTGAYKEIQEVLPNQPCLVDLVDLYVRGLLIGQQPHDRDLLTQMIGASACMQKEVAHGV